MQKRHRDPENYFDEQALSGRRYYVPYIAGHVATKGSVLEIGCGWGGALSAFAEQGYSVTGVDLQPHVIEFARDIFVRKGLAGTFVHADVFDFAPQRKYDIIVMHDAIEHIPEKERLMLKIKELLSPGGVLYVAFPPWRMPFGGHQQMAKSRVMANMPYVHLLPRPIFRALFRLFGESDSAIDYYFELRGTRISIDGFERLARRTGYGVLHRRLWLVNPNYRTKFGLYPCKQLPILDALPWVRDFFTTTCYYLLTAETVKGDRYWRNRSSLDV